MGIAIALVVALAVSTTDGTAACSATSSRRQETTSVGHPRLEIVRWYRPSYPVPAVEANVQGSVDVEFDLSATAQIAGVRAVSGPEPLRAAAVSAARGWRFRFRDGAAPEPLTVRVTFTFVEEYGLFFASLGFLEDPELFPQLLSPGLPPEGVDESASRQGSRSSTQLSDRPGSDADLASAASVRPRFLDLPRPEYTELARQNRTGGVVTVRACFGADGTVKEVLVVSGLPDGLNLKTVTAVRDLRFVPATNRDGVPVDAWTTLRVGFSIR